MAPPEIEVVIALALLEGKQGMSKDEMDLDSPNEPQSESNGETHFDSYRRGGHPCNTRSDKEQQSRAKTTQRERAGNT